MIQIPTPTQAFFQQVLPYVVSFLAVVIPAFGAWIVTQLKANHTATADAAAAAKSAAQAVAVHSADASLKLNNIEGKVDGAMTALTDKSNQQTADALADKDRQIAALTARPLGGTQL